MTKLHIASAFGFLGVALGAFGAHGLEKVLLGNNSVATWDTAALYHLVHAVLLVVVAVCLPKSRLPFILFSVGITLFSGSLYLLAYTKFTKLAYITPLGGLCLLAGWVALALAANLKR